METSAKKCFKDLEWSHQHCWDILNIIKEENENKNVLSQMSLPCHGNLQPVCTEWISTQAKGCSDHKGAATRMMFETTELYRKSAGRYISSWRAGNADRQSSLQEQPELERRTRGAHRRKRRKGQATAWAQPRVNFKDKL